VTYSDARAARPVAQHELRVGRLRAAEHAERRPAHLRVADAHDGTGRHGVRKDAVRHVRGARMWCAGAQPECAHANAVGVPACARISARSRSGACRENQTHRCSTASKSCPTSSAMGAEAGTPRTTHARASTPRARDGRRKNAMTPGRRLLSTRPPCSVHRASVRKASV
jgi:hypothetical protein